MSHHRFHLASAPHALSSPMWVRWGLAAGLTLLAACGGGGGGTAGGSAGSTTAASYTSGVISGFGSIIVNGVRYDDSSATVLDDDGVQHDASSLGLGAAVEIESGPVDHATGKATASTIRLGGELVGPVQALNTAASQFTLLGQTVEVNTSTVYDSSLSGGLNAVTTGAVLAIHAHYDASRAVYLASRVEARADATTYRVGGPISALNTSLQQFQIGTALISYASLSPQPSSLADGQSVRVKLQTTPVNGAWVATALKGAEREVHDHAEAEVRGLITAWTSATQFSVDGLPVDASSATFPQGQSAVMLGAQVEVAGAVVNGVLVATRVAVETETEAHQGMDHELHGALSALDTSAKTFSLRGLTVSYANVTTWTGLTEADLADGLHIEVKGDLAADGVTLAATRISLDH